MIDLASLYQRRWKIETAFAQLKTQLGEALALRSKTPELVMQEFYALLMANAAIQRLMSAAATQTDQASVDLSFVHTGRGSGDDCPRKRAFPLSPLSPLSNAKSGSTAYWPRSLPSRV